MGRGGRRSTTFNPTWKHGKTRTIRVPVALADQLLDIARELDEGRELAVIHAKEKGIEEAILTTLERFIASERSRGRKPNQYTKEFSTDGRDWNKLRQFRGWVKND